MKTETKMIKDRNTEREGPATQRGQATPIVYPNRERCVFIESTEPNACYQCGERRENHEL